MNNADIQVFDNDQFGKIRVKEIDNVPWFAAADVCKALEIGNVSMALDRLDSDEKGVSLIDTLGGKQNLAIVNEAGLYTLVLGSRKLEARAFKRWVTHDILPSVRKNGMWAKDELLDNPDLLLDVVTKLKQERDVRLALEAQNAVLLPKADFYDAVIESSDTIEMATVAKILNVGIGRNRLFEILREQKILRDDNTPLQSYVDLGWFKCVESKYTKPDGGTFINVKTVVYQKGIDGILKLLKEKYNLKPIV